MSKTVNSKEIKKINACITLKDFEIRYQNILKKYPNIPRCSVVGCNNPIDGTKLLGYGSTCAYHRLLFDFWSADIDPMMRSTDGFQNRLTHQKERRAAFTRWRNKIGKEECDKIVLKMACEPINWEC